MIKKERKIINKQKIIGFDLDDVLLAFNESINNWYNKNYGTSYKRDDLKTSMYMNMWNCDREEATKRIFDFYDSEEHFSSLPIVGAVDAVKKLKADGHILYVISAKPEWLREKMQVWFDKYFPNTFDEIYYTNQYTATSVLKKKSQICKELGIEIFVDDFVHNAEDISESGIPVLLFNAPWNQIDVGGLINRVHSWEEIVEKINGK